MPQGRLVRRRRVGVTVNHLLLGMMLVALGLWGLYSWWASFGDVVRGLLPFALLAIGLLAVLSGYNRMMASYDDEEEGEG